MSYAEIKPQYYQMHMPDSPWHAGSEGWKDAPWPTFGVNPNLVGPPRLAVEGLGSPSAMGAYFKPEYERAISGLGLGDIRRVSTYRPVDGMGAYFKPVYETPISGLGACPCSGGSRGFGADAAVVSIPSTANKTNAALLIGLGLAVIVGGVVFLGPHHH